MAKHSKQSKKRELSQQVEYFGTGVVAAITMSVMNSVSDAMKGK